MHMSHWRDTSRQVSAQHPVSDRLLPQTRFSLLQLPGTNTTTAGTLVVRSICRGVHRVATGGEQDGPQFGGSTYVWSDIIHSIGRESRDLGKGIDVASAASSRSTGDRLATDGRCTFTESGRFAWPHVVYVQCQRL